LGTVKNAFLMLSDFDRPSFTCNVVRGVSPRVKKLVLGEK